MTVSDLALHHVSAGPTGTALSGEPIIFLHALGCDLHVWENVATPLSAGRRVIRYDLRGHGLSDCGPPECTIEDHVRDLIGLLDRLNIPSAALVGLSVGGLISLAAALRHPTRIKRIALCGAAARIGTRESWTERMHAVKTQGLEGLADTIIGRWFTPAFATREPAVVRGFRNRIIRTPANGYLATCAALRDANYREQAEGLRVPALIISGEHDVVVPPAIGRELADVLPDAHWHLVPGCAHLPPVEQPAATLTAVARFLAER